MLLSARGQLHQLSFLRAQIPKVQKDCQVKQLFALLGSACIKTARRVGEIEPRFSFNLWYKHLSTFAKVLSRKDKKTKHIFKSLVVANNFVIFILQEKSSFCKQFTTNVFYFYFISLKRGTILLKFILKVKYK